MTDLKFENTILNAKIAALEAEAEKAQNKSAAAEAAMATLKAENGRLQRNVEELNNKLAASHQQIERLKADQTKLAEIGRLQAQVKSDADKIDRLERQNADLRNTDEYRQIAGLKQKLNETERARTDEESRRYAMATVNEKLREENKILNYRLSSPYMTQLRGRWRGLAITASISAAGLLIALLMFISQRL